MRNSATLRENQDQAELPKVKYWLGSSIFPVGDGDYCHDFLKILSIYHSV